MADITLKAAIPEELYHQFRQAVTDKNGKWRGSKQTSEKAFQTAVEAALLQFLDSLNAKNNNSTS